MTKLYDEIIGSLNQNAEYLKESKGWTDSRLVFEIFDFYLKIFSKIENKYMKLCISSSINSQFLNSLFSILKKLPYNK